MEQIDWGNITLVGLVIIGTVNAVTMFKPDLDSRYKFIISVVVALVVSFIPAEIGSMIYDKLIFALAAATASSGAYKVSQKIGGE